MSDVRAWCQVCGEPRWIRRGQRITPFCSTRCEEDFVATMKTAPTDSGPTEDEKEKILRLIALANDKSAPFGESANAARAACKLIEKYGALSKKAQGPKTTFRDESEVANRRRSRGH